MWVSDARSWPRFSCTLPPNTLNISYMTKLAQNKIITHINFLEKQLVWPALIFYYRFCVGWNLMRPMLLLVIKSSMGSRKLLWSTTMVQLTLNIIFSVTYYLTLCIAITIYCVSLNLLRTRKIGYLDMIEHSHLCLVKIYINSRKIALCTSEQ